MRRRAMFLAALLILLLSVSVGAAPARNGYPLTLVDDLGRRLVLPARPKRIVSLAPSVTELLFASGFGDRVVGVTRWCDYPAAAKTLPKVGDLNLSEERIAALRPDLIVGDRSLERPFLDRLERLGWPVLTVGPQRAADIPHAMLLLARAAGDYNAGLRASTRFKARLAKLMAEGARNARRHGGPLRLFLLLDPDQLYTAGPGTFLDDLVTLAGGRNVAGKAKTAWPLFSEEALLLADPQVIVVAAPSSTLFSKPRWQGISAVRARKVYQVDPDLLSRTGPRVLDGLAFLISTLQEQR